MMAPPFAVRVARPHRYAYLLSASLARAGAEVTVSMAQVEDVRSKEKEYFAFLRDEPNVVFAEGTAGVLLDFAGGPPPRGSWSAEIGVVTARRTTPVVLGTAYDKHLVTGDAPVVAEDARSVQIAHCPFWPHPRVFRSNPAFYGATEGPRPVGAVLAATMRPPERIALAEQLRDRIGDCLIPADAGDAQELIRERPRCVIGLGRVCTFETWLELLRATRWCVDVAGFEFVTHRAIEAGMSGCAIILDERSAAAYDPPFRDGVDCRTYEASSFADVVLDALAMPERERLRLAVAAQTHVARHSGPQAVLERVLQLVDA